MIVSRRVTLVAGMASMAWPASAAASFPRRVVSLNPCLDAILVRLAPRHQIAAISHFSRISQQSNIYSLAQTLPITRETAEEIVSLRPDLVLSSQHSSRATRNALTRLGIAVELFGVPQTIGESLEQVDRIGALTGHAGRASALRSEITRHIERSRIQPNDRRLKAVLFQPNGFAAGQGTLMSEMMEIAGFDNVAGRYGVGKWGNLSLEHLIANPPEVLLSGAGSPGARSWAERIMLHPALHSISHRMAQVEFPEKLLYCGGPVLIDTATALVRARQQALEALQ
ncbi:ABC transporter substrate-binding protein [Brevundimonas sp. GN22]